MTTPAVIDVIPGSPIVVDVVGISGPAGPQGPAGAAGATGPAGADASQGRYIVGCFVPGVMTASQYLLLHRFTKAITIPANFGTYLGHVSEARGTANATASIAIDVRRALSASPGTFVSIGTITVAAGAMVATFVTSGGVDISFAQGDSLALIAPATSDATFTNFAATLVGHE